MPLSYQEIKAIVDKLIDEGMVSMGSSQEEQPNTPNNINTFKGSSKYNFNETVSFLTDVLKGLGISNPNQSQISFIKAWRQHEGGSATFNPFNTTLKKPNSKPFNQNSGFPVQNYSDRETGLKATIETLSAYNSITKAIKNIKNDKDIDKAMQALNDSSWGSNFNPPNYRFWKTLNNFISIPPIISK